MKPGESLPGVPVPPAPPAVPASTRETPDALGTRLHSVDERLASLGDLSLDLQVRTLAAVEADLRSALEAARN